MEKRFQAVVLMPPIHPFIGGDAMQGARLPSGATSASVSSPWTFRLVEGPGIKAAHSSSHWRPEKPLHQNHSCTQ